MRILLTGARGKVGMRLSQLLPAAGETVACDRAGLDLSDPDSIRDVIRTVRPDVIVNAAGYTRVDQAESDKPRVFAVNAVGPGIMAEEARRLGALLVHFSSVYIFDGLKAGPYVEEDEPGPVNSYGLSKLRGEQAIAAAGCEHLILRASWVYDSHGRDDFVLTMLRLAAERDALRVVDDQLGCPTSAHAIAVATVEAIALLRAAKAAAGTYNLASLGAVSRFDFSMRLLDLTRDLRPGRGPTAIERIKTADFPVVARRPLNSVLDCRRIASAGVRLSSWQDQLAEFVGAMR